MTPPDDMSPLIRALGDSSAPDRERAAREIFRRGQSLARPAVEQWLADKELAATFLPLDSGFPETTVGLAVTPQNFERIRKSCGLPRLAGVPPDQDAMEFELHFGGDVRLDILTSRDPQAAGAIARFLQEFGEGIQQVELVSQDVDRATRILRERFGIEPIYPATRPGADRTRVNFFLVATPAGRKALLELVEPRR
jgi:hypothetical protein